MKQPLISIVIPSLNQGAYLDQCLKSVVNQKYKFKEIVVIDGGSIDKSTSIIDSYRHSIKYFVSEKDGGQSDAINKGLKFADGELVAWLNADDYYLDNVFEILVPYYLKNKKTPFFFGNGIRVDEFGGLKSEFFPRQNIHFDKFALQYGMNYILQPSTFINRNLLEKVNYLDPSLHYGMDSDLWLKLSETGSPVFINEILSASREYKSTKTSLGSFKRVEELRLISKRYSNHEITPGILCYFLDTLYKYTTENKEYFSDEYLIDIVDFWMKTQKLLLAKDIDEEGFPK
jgi:glycosyltransferase involved in cell wall biosynthesis